MADNNNLRVTQSKDTWVTQEHYVERLMDNAAFTAAHPDDTLFLAGPARYASDNSFIDKLLPIGQVMNFTMAGNAPVQPLTAIGSGRSFFVRGKGNVSLSIGRLFLNGRNLLRVLYTSAVQAGVDVSAFDDVAADEDANIDQRPSKFFLNLDSELFYVPFGIAALFRDKSKRTIGAFYVELCMITAYNLGVASGQAMIMENVSIVADRVKPIFANDFVPQPTQPGQDKNQNFLDMNQNIMGLGTTETDFVPALSGDTPK